MNQLHLHSYEQKPIKLLLSCKRVFENYFEEKLIDTNFSVYNLVRTKVVITFILREQELRLKN